MVLGTGCTFQFLQKLLRLIEIFIFNLNIHIDSWRLSNRSGRVYDLRTSRDVIFQQLYRFLKMVWLLQQDLRKVVAGIGVTTCDCPAKP